MSTLTQPQHRASDASAKTFSGPGEARRKPWRRRGKAEQQAGPVEHSTYPKPDAPTQILPAAQTGPAASSLPPLHRDSSTNPDMVAVNIISVCAQSMREHWSSTRLMDSLLAHNGELHKRSMREQEGGATIARRVANGHRTAQETAEAIEAAVRVEQLTGVPVPLDPQAMGKRLGGLAVNAHDLNERTMVGLMAPITDETPDPRVVSVVPATASADPAAIPSPVHANDGTTPPVPDAGDEDADPGSLKPLPKRVPQATTHMVLPATDLDPYEAVDPTLNGQSLQSGAWVFDEGTGAGGPVWFLLAEQANELRDSGRVAVLRFANGLVREVNAGGQVRVLDVRRAQVLVSQIEQRMAQRDAGAAR